MAELQIEMALSILVPSPLFVKLKIGFKMKNNGKNTLEFNKLTLSELSESALLKINGGTLETSGYCCFTTREMELANA